MDQTTTGVTADSPTAPSASLPDLNTLTGPDLDSWRLTGKVPETTVADSSPAKSVDQAASTEVQTPPASEPGSPKGKGIKERHAELDAEIASLQAKLATRKQLREQVEEPSTPKAEPKAQAAPWDGTDPADPKPTLETFTGTTDEFMDARDSWNERRIDRKRFAQSRAHQAQTAEERIRQTFASRRDAAIEADPSLKELLATSEVPVTEFTKDYIERVPHGIAVMKHLATHPEMAAKLLHINPWAQHRELVLLEHALTAQSATTGTQTPTPKTVSGAPEPPPTLGSKPMGSHADTIEAAIARGDTEAYNRLANQRDLAAAR